MADSGVYAAVKRANANLRPDADIAVVGVVTCVVDDGLIRTTMLPFAVDAFVDIDALTSGHNVAVLHLVRVDGLFNQFVVIVVLAPVFGKDVVVIVTLPTIGALVTVAH